MTKLRYASVICGSLE